jgi:hypothetical protein
MPPAARCPVRRRVFVWKEDRQLEAETQGERNETLSFDPPYTGCRFNGDCSIRWAENGKIKQVHVGSESGFVRPTVYFRQGPLRYLKDKGKICIRI